MPEGTYRFMGSTIEEQEAFREDILRLLETDGPFDGVMGYSEGGGVAAWLLILDGLLHPERPRLKCGILMCPTGVDEADMDVADAQLVRARPGEILIKVPTAHIWSLRSKSTLDDDVIVDEGNGKGNGGQHKSLKTLFDGMGKFALDLCEPSLREEYRHEMGHVVPGDDSDEGVKETVRAIERTIERVRDMQEE